MADMGLANKSVRVRNDLPQRLNNTDDRSPVSFVRFCTRNSKIFPSTPLAALTNFVPVSPPLLPPCENSLADNKSLAQLGIRGILSHAVDLHSEENHRRRRRGQIFRCCNPATRRKPDSVPRPISTTVTSSICISRRCDDAIKAAFRRSTVDRIFPKRRKCLTKALAVFADWTLMTIRPWLARTDNACPSSSHSRDASMSIKSGVGTISCPLRRCVLRREPSRSSSSGHE